MIFNITTSSFTENLTIHEEDVLSLVGCAVARRSFPELGFSDPTAEEVVAGLDLDCQQWDERRLLASIKRTVAVDMLVREFWGRHPDGLAIALLPGICTRFTRVDNGHARWLDLEPLKVASFKNGLFSPSDRYMSAQCCSVGCSGWMKHFVGVDDMPLLIVAQAGFRRASPDLRDKFFTNAAIHLPEGTELIVEHDAMAPLRSSLPSIESSAISTPNALGEWVIYPRIRFVPSSERKIQLEEKVSEINAVAKLFNGRRMPSIAHLRLS